MGKSTTFDNDLLKLIFQATTITGVAQNASSPITNLYVSLHTADPHTGSQTTSEAAYPSYARVAVARTSGGWTITGASVVPAATITFPTSTGSPTETETYFGIGTLSSGAGELLYSGAISPTIAVNAAGVTPSLTVASTVTES